MQNITLVMVQIVNMYARIAFFLDISNLYLLTGVKEWNQYFYSNEYFSSRTLHVRCIRTFTSPQKANTFDRRNNEDGESVAWREKLTFHFARHFHCLPSRMMFNFPLCRDFV